MLMEITTGKETHRNGSAQVHVFACLPAKPGSKVLKEEPISLTAKSRPATETGITNLRQVHRYQAYPDTGDRFGVWYVSRYEMRDDVILKIFATRTNYRQPKAHGAVFIRTRLNAAMQEITVPLICGENCSLRVARIEGRFDVLTLRQARDLGCVVSQQFEVSHDQANIDRVMTIRQIARPASFVSDEVHTVPVGPENTDMATVVTKRNARRLSLPTKNNVAR